MAPTARQIADWLQIEEAEHAPATHCHVPQDIQPDATQGTTPGLVPWLDTTRDAPGLGRDEIRDTTAPWRSLQDVEPDATGALEPDVVDGHVPQDVQLDVTSDAIPSLEPGPTDGLVLQDFQPAATLDATGDLEPDATRCLVPQDLQPDATDSPAHVPAITPGPPREPSSPSDPPQESAYHELGPPQDPALDAAALAGVVPPPGVEAGHQD
ncbi:hypothetical protein T484DRAFT_1869735 [Baffinella frigidus]|nr:hypothetical protein T484DRAFT_1869735 [Cryptophyta sp. CCMP2293]